MDFDEIFFARFDPTSARIYPNRPIVVPEAQSRVLRTPWRGQEPVISNRGGARADLRRFWGGSDTSKILEISNGSEVTGEWWKTPDSTCRLV